MSDTEGNTQAGVIDIPIAKSLIPDGNIQVDVVDHPIAQSLETCDDDHAGMKLTASQICIVSMDEYGISMHFPPDQQVDTPDGVFLRIKAMYHSRQSVCQMVYEANDMATHFDDARKRTLTTSKGYKHIMQLRNEASRINEAPPVQRCTLFDRAQDDADTRKNKKHKPQDQQRQERDDAGVVSIVIDLDDKQHRAKQHTIDVIKAVHPTDVLAIKHDMKMMGVAIQYMRTKGFDDPKPRSDLPKGIYRPQNITLASGKLSFDGAVLASVKLANGRTIYKKALLEKALEWQQQVVVGDDDDSGRDVEVDVDTPPRA